MAVQPPAVSEASLRAFALQISVGQGIDRQALNIRDAAFRGDIQEATRLAAEIGVDDYQIFARKNDIPAENEDQRYLDAEFRKEQARRVWHLIDVDPINWRDPVTGDSLTFQQRTEIGHFCREEEWDIFRGRCTAISQAEWDALSPVEKLSVNVKETAKTAFNGFCFYANKAIEMTRPIETWVFAPIMRLLPQAGPQRYIAGAAVITVSVAGTLSFFYQRPYR